ncbi:MAG: DUF928 domain-containing protein [Hormoscilla sp.]
MTTKNERRSLHCISLALGLVMMFFPGLWKLVHAQSYPERYRQELPGMVKFEPPPEKGAPEETVMGGSRGNCNSQGATSSAAQMTLLMPENNYGLTVAAHPKLFIYIPETAARALFVKLKDESDREHYQKIVPIKSGIVNISLPREAPPLEIGKTYKLFAAMLCGYDPESEQLDPDQPYSVNDPWTQAAIKRIAPNSIISGNLDSIGELQQAALYAENGIWVETIAILAELRQARPADATIAREWTELLTSVGRETISAQKFAE